MVIHFHRRGHGFNKNETVAVVAVENDSLKVQRADGTETFFHLGQGTALCDVGERRKLKIAAGDKLLLQANAVAVRKHFINGELVEVRAIQGDSLVLADGRVIPADYRTFTHGYAVTSHAAQGKTVDEVLLVASSRSLPAINQEQFYVSISRGRERCQIFTDDSELLRLHVTHSSARLAAVEAMPQPDFLQTILQRGHRFLKRFRQRLAHSLPTKTTERSSHEIKPNEHQRQSTRHISI
jgi:ATP-dependent exoDNAse (exonuclease V) alpha subunit